MNYRKMRLSGLIDKVVADTDGRRALDFCFVLGAGASISSGIPSGQKLVARWEKELAEAYADHEDWKAKHGITADNMAEHYSDYYHAKFPERFEGYNYLEGIMQGASPSAGYAALAYLLCRKGHRLVITTNFDPMTEDAIRLLEHEHPLVIGHESLAELIRDKTSRPTVVKIHRDLLMRPKNEAAEVAELADAWKENLPYVFENYHPIFVGYAGNDGSLMNWLQENADKFRSGAWKTPYWTLYGREVLSGKAKTFMETAGGSVISECDFDELMIILATRLGYQFPKKEDYLRQCEADWTRISDKLNEVLSGKKPEPPASGGDLSSTAPARAEAGEADLMFRKAIGSLVDPTDPPDEENRYRSALIAWRHARDSEAETILRALCADFPENARYHDSLSTTLHEMQRYDEALAESRRAVELEPENAKYHYSLGVTLHEMQRYDEALAESRRAVELEPGNAKYHYSLGVTLHAMQRYEDALAEKRRAVELEPENARYHDSLGTTLHEMQRYEDALAESRRAVELEPENAEWRDSLGVTLHKMQRYEDALAEKRRAVELEPGNARYHDSLSTTLHEMQRYEDALAEKRRAVELEPGNAEYHYSLGVTLHKMQRYEDALAEKRRAVELEPENARYHNSLSTTLHEMQRYEDALAESRRAVELEPENARYHQQKGVTLHAMQRYEDALAESRRAVELEPENARYHDSLSTTLHKIQRYDEALAESRRAVELEPENARYHDSLSTTLHKIQRYDEALAESRRAVELEPENAEWRDSLAVTLDALGQKKAAAKERKQARALRDKQGKK